jgi:hypothetical protein
MIQFDANIFPVFEDLTPEELKTTTILSKRIPAEMEHFFSEAPLTQTPVATIAKAEVETGMEHTQTFVKNYQFVITRRYMHNGELHVGGANGEVLNVYLLIEALKTFIEKQQARKEYYERGGQ